MLGPRQCVTKGNQRKRSQNHSKTFDGTAFSSKYFHSQLLFNEHSINNIFVYVLYDQYFKREATRAVMQLVTR